MPSSDSHFDLKQISVARNLARAAALIAAGGGALVLTGWALNIDRLTAMVPGQAPMRPFTALAMLLLGAALWLACDPASRGPVRSPWLRRLGLIGAGLVAGLDAIFLLEYLLGADFGFDQLLFRQALAASHALPLGRPAQVTALCLLLLGLALFTLDRRPGWLAPLAALAAVLLAGLALLGYAYAVTTPLPIWPYGSVAPQTGVLIMMLGLGVLAARPEGAITRIVTTRLAGSAIARRLLPAAVLVPFVLGGLRLYGQRLGLYDTTFGVALLVTSNVVVFAILILATARLLNQSDARRVAAHEALRESDENLRLVLDGVHGHAIYMLDPQGRVATWNKAAERIQGYTAAEIIGQPVSVFYRPADVAEGKPERVLAAAAAKGAATEDGWRVRKDGSQFWATIDTAALRDQNGVLRGYAKVARDNTERKQAEEALREREERLRVLADATPNGLLIAAAGGDITWANRRAEILFGYAPGQLLGCSIDQLVPHRHQPGHAGHRAEFAADRRARLMGAGPDLFGLRPDGSEFPVEIGLSPIETSQGQATLASIIDISERKRADDVLRNSEERFAKAFRASPAAMTMSTLADGRFLDANDRFLELLGYARDEVLGQTSTGLGMFPDPAERAEFARRLRTEGKVRNLELVLITKTGQPRNVLFSTDSIEVDGQATILASMIDTTERKQAVEALRQLNTELEARVAARTAELAANEAKLRALFEVLPVGISILDRERRVVETNPALGRILRIPDVQPTAAAYTVGRAVINPDGSPMPLPAYASVRAFEEQRPVLNVETGVVLESGETIWLDVSAAPLPGDNPGVVTATVDITERRRFEAELHQSNERFTKAFDSNPTALTITRLADNVFVDVNEGFQRLSGYTRAELVGRPVSDLNIETLGADRAEMARQFREHGSIREHEIVLRTKDGDLRQMLLSADTLDLAGQPHILTTMLDITTRKQTEAALAASEAKFRVLFDVLPVGVSIVDSARRVVQSNPALSRIIKLSAASVAAAAYLQRRIIRPDGSDMPEAEWASTRALAEQQPVLDIETGSVLETGETIWFASSAVPLPVAGLGAVVVTVDITERKAAALALARERDLMRALMDNIPDTIYFKDTASRFTRVNRAQAEYLRLPSAEAAIGLTDVDLQDPVWARAVLDEEQQIVLRGQPLLNRVDDFVADDGQRHWMSSTKVPLRDASGQVTGLVGISRDITALKQAEANLQASLIEKEVLLKEIHHRVKNNLQIISSLLRMQADTFDDPKLRAAFDDSQRRVRSMALIHEQLYRSPDLVHIDFGEYVNGLMRQLRHSQMQWGSALRMRVEIEDVTLEIDRAIPLGLMVNELVTNSLKYAFPLGRTPAEVWVTATRDAAGTLTLVVGDSGVGLPETVNVEDPPSMGWQLVQSFVSQLRAHYTLQRQPGTVFTLTVPDGKKAHG